MLIYQKISLLTDAIRNGDITDEELETVLIRFYQCGINKGLEIAMKELTPHCIKPSEESPSYEDSADIIFNNLKL